MTPEEVFDLLTQKIAPRDGRTVGKVDVAIWCEDIGGLNYADACEAVARHYRESSDWLMPKHVHDLVKRIRAERLADSDRVVPAADPDDPKAYIAALRSNYRDLADGVPPRRAIAAGPVDAEQGADDVRAILSEFKARKAAAEAARRAEFEEARRVTRIFIDAQERLLGMPDLGAAVLAKAQEALFGDEQAAAGFPRAAQSTGVDDRQKTAILAAQFADAEADEETTS